MRQIVFTLLGLLMITSASAEDAEYYPLVREGVTWYYLRYQGQVNIAYVSPDYLYSFCCDGDTTVMDKNDEMKTYKKVVYREYDNLKNETFSVVLRGMREESKVVYSKDLYENIYEIPIELKVKPVMLYPYWSQWDSEDSIFYVDHNYYEIPIYDFNRETYLPDDNGISHYFRRHYTDTTVMVNGESHNAYAINAYPNYYTGTVIEGIGIDSGIGHLLAPQYPMTAGVDTIDGLAWVEESGVIIYKGVMYDKAMEYLTATGVSTVAGDKQVKSVRYYNLAGVESAQPVKGVNIKVTTYSDGTTKSEKMVR